MNKILCKYKSINIIKISHIKLNDKKDNYLFLNINRKKIYLR